MSREKLSTCGAKNRSGKPCARPAGWGTDHPGEGRCKLHGGVGQKTSLRYAEINASPRLRQLIDDAIIDDDPMNLLPELALLRALVQDYVERYDAMTAALLAWHESYQIGGSAAKPKQIVDILQAGNFLDKIGSLAKTIQSQRKEGMIPLAAFARMLPKVGLALIEATREVGIDEAERDALLRAFERRVDGIEPEPEIAAVAGALAGHTAGAGRTIN
ncbi:HGGxSTG domain-containing protein [Deinococcus fonticola]|uniref:HGGxSTG domain-containing protein n=1 Tax=Deinococcus fonticola TaxID=2528713 RepID=UPI001F111FCC|nr:HGGxSTG domain-containing protein [Deinococcus fonticola]